jgi:hypothetical protein
MLTYNQWLTDMQHTPATNTKKPKGMWMMLIQKHAGRPALTTQNSLKPAEQPGSWTHGMKLVAPAHFTNRH